MQPHQIGFQVDLDRCVGCRACELACQHQHPESLAGFRHVERLHASVRVQGLLSLACNHCAAPECMRVCPEHCYDKLRNGIVRHHSESCVGCGRCVGACPFGAPRLNPRTQKAEKCDFCEDRLTRGQLPACVEACPVGALQLIELGELTEADKNLPDYPLIRYTQPSIRFVPARQPIRFLRKEAKSNDQQK
ncbi:Fe-S-cluster-containing dehydrogenase component [Selenomonas sp. GACV-9]|uniref:4Fe-4S dicluster domain-containing protein n=1 Tax=Selenomonas sp. GACV-9 TaxID=3158782 RepID=UPI0008EB8BBE|nr:Fe-S-cluster-containing dehydrogenase component [Selenomonas ruminantium]